MTQSDIWIIKRELKVQLTLKIPGINSVSLLIETCRRDNKKYATRL